MAQPSVMIVSLAVLATLGGFAYVHANREEPRPVEPSRAAVATITQAAPSPIEASPPKEPARQIATDDVSHLIADTQSNDAKTRAAAIGALADAPKSQAVPALKRVLEIGEPLVDRQIALQSLHKLALNDGDHTGAIRDILRHAMYHSDDEGVTQTAQALLEDIEAALAED
jgi:HEAT repeat protein